MLRQLSIGFRNGLIPGSSTESHGSPLKMGALQKSAGITASRRRSSKGLFSQAPMSNDELVVSNSPTHPANLICELCRLFYSTLPIHTGSDNTDNGWVTGTGGGMTIRHELSLTILI